MQKKSARILGVLIVFILLSISTYSYAKYIFNKKLDISIGTAPFYFDAVGTTDTFTFERTTPTTDIENILTTSAPVSMKIKNNDGTNYNSFATNYTVSVVNSNKFEVEGTTLTKTIAGGKLIEDTISFNLKIKDLSDPQKTVTIRVTSTSPYSKSIDVTFKVVQKGAIQTIEDLLDLSIAMRDNINSVKNERFKLTRDLDFGKSTSFDNSERTDYGDANRDSKVNGNLFAELTQDPGWLPIGDETHKFSGVFNGGNHSISNLYMHKALQTNIGLFGFTEGANIRNLTIIGGKIVNDNETAGMIVGRVQGGTIENITVDGTSVMSTDKSTPDRDTYAGGIAGYVQRSATIKNCINKAQVTSQFTGDTNSFSGVAGGIVAWMSFSTIEDCKNYGVVTGQKFSGGIVGFASMQDQDDNNNNIGSNGGGTVRNCENYANVTTYITTFTTRSGPGTDIGGVAGYNKAGGTVTNCKNHSTATITGINYIGGIVGYNVGTITGCINYSTNISSTAGQTGVGRITGYQGGTSTGNTELGSNEVIANEVSEDPILVNRILSNYHPLTDEQVKTELNKVGSIPANGTDDGTFDEPMGENKVEPMSENKIEPMNENKVEPMNENTVGAINENEVNNEVPTDTKN